MTGLEQFILGVIGSAFVAWVSDKDQKLDEAGKARLKKLLEACERYKTPEARAGELSAGTLGDAVAADPEMVKLDKYVIGDPVIASQIAGAVLEADPAVRADRREQLARELADNAKVDAAKVRTLLESVETRAEQDFGLSQLRSHKEHALMLAEVREQATLLRAIHRSNGYIVSLLLRLLAAEPIPVTPVRPVRREPKPTNGLLWGKRPFFEDIEQGIDFRRSVYPRVMETIARAKAPAMFAFLGDTQVGKTTFLLRLGYDLAMLGHPVLALDAADEGTPYAKWLERHVSHFSDLPVVLLVDNPAHRAENFISQMVHLSDKRIPVLVLTAEQRRLWQERGLAQHPLYAEERVYGLDLAHREVDALIDRLEETGMVAIPSEKRDALHEAVSRVDGGPGYLARVIGVVSKGHFRHVDYVVKEALDKHDGDPGAAAFKKLYTLVCVPGRVGLALPEKIAKDVLSVDELGEAFAFNRDLAVEAIRITDGELAVTHERHAARFIEDSPVSDPNPASRAFAAIVNVAVEDPVQTPFLGDLFDTFRMRGLGAGAVEAWDAIHDRVSAEHWRACSAESLSQIWGAFLYLSGRSEAALTVNSAAVEKAPAADDVHNNYAIVLVGAGDTDAAREHYERALEINPRNQEAHYNYAILLEDAGETDAACEHYEEALEINPRHAEAHYNYAILLKGAGETGAARAHYERALEIDPRHAKATANLSVLERDRGAVDKAVALATRAILLGTLPDGGAGLVAGYAEHIDALREQALSADESAECRAGAFMFLAVLAEDTAAEVAAVLKQDPQSEEIARIANQIRAVWAAAASQESESSEQAEDAEDSKEGSDTDQGEAPGDPATEC